MAREINLVPDIKDEMIKTLKLRNYIFFACFVVAAASVGVTLIFGLIVGGQQLARDSKKTTIDQLHDKLNSYNELSDMLTIKDQVNNIDTLTENKQLLSRTFSALSAMIPTGADTIKISELTVNLKPDAESVAEEGEEITEPTFAFEAQANAGKEPFIDYNVLDSFKKSMQYMRYDYGKYVDKENNEIPAYCMIEQGSDGATFKEDKDGQPNFYAYWTIEAEGCNPSEEIEPSDYKLEDYDGQKVVKIWRTPQFSDWYQKSPKDQEPSISLDGTISNVEHFSSECITYTGDDSEDESKPKWSEDNQCLLVNDESGEESIVINESSNGRDSSNELVLRFSATIKLNSEFFKFDNTHMLALPPSGRRNVTDSYVQVQAMFSKRAKDCDKNDTACIESNKNKSNKNSGDE